MKLSLIETVFVLHVDDYCFIQNSVVFEVSIDYCSGYSMRNLSGSSNLDYKHFPSLDFIVDPC